MVGLTSTTAVGSTTEESPNDKHQDHRSRGTVAGHDSSGLILTCHLEFSANLASHKANLHPNTSANWGS